MAAILLSIAITAAAATLCCRGEQSAEDPRRDRHSHSSKNHGAVAGGVGYAVFVNGLMDLGVIASRMNVPLCAASASGEGKMRKHLVLWSPWSWAWQMGWEKSLRCTLIAALQECLFAKREIAEGRRSRRKSTRRCRSCPRPVPLRNMFSDLARSSLQASNIVATTSWVITSGHQRLRASADLYS